MKNNKMRASAIIAIFLTCSMCLVGNATDNAKTNAETTSNIPPNTTAPNSTIGTSGGGERTKTSWTLPPYSVKQSATILGEDVPLYATFDDPHMALQETKIALSDCLNKIAIQYSNDNNKSLDELNENNWKIYYEYLTENQCGDKIAGSDYIMLARFFDIYENSDQNDDIIELSVSPSLLSRDASNETISSIASMLPYTSDLWQNYAGRAGRERAEFNTSRGIWYAKEYAVNPNVSQYIWFKSGDCTNFASQILFNGGVRMVVTNDVTTGWWYKGGNNNLLQKNSQTWSFARNFAFYQGVYGKTSSIKTFTASLRAGDFLGIDQDGDGDIDHIGFATEVGTYGTYTSKTYGTKSYTDIKIAQHTTNYHQWISSEKNGWEGWDKQGTFARLRRK